MRVETLTSAGAVPARLVQPSSVRSLGEVRTYAELERFKTAVAGFIALCRAEQLPPDAVMTRFEAFLAAWD